MGSPYVCFILFSIFTLLSLSIADDGEVMNDLLSSLGDSPPSSWNIATFYCTWTGVKCDSSSRVISISLPGRSLSGVHPPTLMYLSELKTLALQRNMLRGRLPSFANMIELEEISLQENVFEDIAADFASGLTNLLGLTLSNNPKLAQWSFPIHLKDSNKLTTLSASNTSLTGSIPDIFYNFTHLENVNLSYNYLSGSLPKSLGSLISLRNLGLNNNNLTGSLPKSLTTLPHLQNIDVSNNTFSGPTLVFSSTVNFRWKGNPSLRYATGVRFTTRAIVAMTLMVLILIGGILSYIFLVRQLHRRLRTWWSGKEA